MFHNRNVPAIALLLLGLAGCASERITLLPDADGKVGALIVTGDNGSEVRLNQAYGSVRVQGSNAEFRQSNAAEVTERYRATLAATPIAARSYILRFASEKTTLLPEAQPTLKAVFDDYRKRPAPEVIIIGHTDKSGDAKYNEELSQRRANAVRSLLIADGVSPDMIETAWRGDREPLPETSGNVYEPRNRRVEIKVR